jgi:hypothetical protein
LQHPLKAQFSESIGLLGYDLSASDLGPGRYVDMTLYWRALERMSSDYTLALQLASLAPGDTRTLLNFNTWPGGGNPAACTCDCCGKASSHCQTT